MNLDEERWPPRGMRVGGLFQWATGNAFSVVGVDLGRRQDHTGIAVVEERRVKTGWDAANWRDTFEIETTVRYLERMPLGTSFTSVVSRVKTVTDSLNDEPPAAVVVDATGLGAPVVEMMKLAELRCQVAPVTITSGDQVTVEDGAFVNLICPF